MTAAGASGLIGIAYRMSPAQQGHDGHMDADVIVVGAGLAGLVATAELADAGRRVIAARPGAGAANLGGQAFWSFGGLFLVDSPEQRRMGIHDSLDLAWQDWLGTAGFDRDRRTTGRAGGPRPTSTSPRARSAPGCTQQGVRLFPVVGWAERGGYLADGPRQLGAALPHHLGHRTRRGRAVRAPRARGGVDARAGRAALPPSGRRADRHRRRGRRRARHGARAEPRRRGRRARRARRSATSSCARRRSSSRPAASAATTTSCAQTGPTRLGTAPEHMISGVPAHVDGRMLAHHASAPAAASSTPTGCGTTPRASRNWDPIWPRPRHPHPARPVVAVAGRDRASGCRCRCSPGFDTLGTLEHILRTGPRAHAGSCSPRRSSRRSSRSPARSRIPTSPARACAQVLGRVRGGAPAPGRGVQGARARTSSSRDYAAPTWSPA